MINQAIVSFRLMVVVVTAVETEGGTHWAATQSKKIHGPRGEEFDALNNNQKYYYFTGILFS